MEICVTRRSTFLEPAVFGNLMARFDSGLYYRQRVVLDTRSTVLCVRDDLPVEESP